MALQAIADYIRTKSLRCCFLALIVLATAMHSFALPTRSMVKLETRNAVTVLPFIPDLNTGPFPNTAHYVYSFSLYYTNINLEQTAYSITPAACVDLIRVNHVLIPFPKNNRCDPRTGFYWNIYDTPLYLNLAPYIKNGRNLIEVQTERAEFNMGPLILFGNNHLSRWLGLTMILVVCIMLVLLMQRLTGGYCTGYLVSCGFLLFMNRLAFQNIAQYSMDLPGHVDYISYIAHHRSLPNPFTGWSYYHAPLYYILGAIIIYFADMCRSFDPFTCLQLFSLSCFLTFIIFSILSLQRLIPQRSAYYAAIIMLIFYPAGIMFSYRIDSNLLFYAAYSGCLYFMLRWLDSDNEKEFVKNLGLTLIMLGVSLATRSNSIILLPLLFFAAIYRTRKGGWPSHLRLRPWIRAGNFILFAGLALSLGRTELYRLIYHHDDSFLIGNINSLSHHLIIQNVSLSKLLIPNIPLYLKNPLWSVWVDDNGRQYFWNSMLKSSLFGEFFWDSPRLAAMLNYLLLGLIAYTIEGYILHRRFLHSRFEWWACLISLAVPIGALMQNRALYGFASSEDFRYIYACIASFCGLFGLVLARHIHEWRPFHKGLGFMMCLAFAFCSARFYFI